MGKKFAQVKRYGLEGAESMMVALDALFHTASKGNWKERLFQPLLSSVHTLLLRPELGNLTLSSFLS